MIAKTNDKERQLRGLREDRQKQLADAAKKCTDIPENLQRMQEITHHDQPPTGGAEQGPESTQAAETKGPTGGAEPAKSMKRPPRKPAIKLVWKDGKAQGKHAHYRVEVTGGAENTYRLIITDSKGERALDPVESPARVAGQAIEHETNLRDEGAPAYKPPATPAKPTESDMRKSKTKAKAKGRSPARTKARTKVKAKTTSKAKTESGVRPGTKLEKVVKLLQRPDGCTNADVLKATDWPSVSMPQQAKAAGITLVKEKVDGVTRYYDKATKAA